MRIRKAAADLAAGRKVSNAEFFTALGALIEASTMQDFLSLARALESAGACASSTPRYSGLAVLVAWETIVRRVTRGIPCTLAIDANLTVVRRLLVHISVCRECQPVSYRA